jgi:Holliday junction resolvasome RuvABC endonuclease subunit
MTHKTLALDISSDYIGICYDGTELETIRLKHPAIANRCDMAGRMIASYILLYCDIDLVVIESPVARYANAVIAQSRVAGAVLAILAQYNLAYIEVSPTSAKKALTGSGKATKQQMMDCVPGSRDDHQADAYALWLVGNSQALEVRA